MDSVNMEPMVAFLTDAVHPDEMSEIIDEVLFDYIYGKIEQAESGEVTKKVNQNIMLLRELRDVFHLL